MGKLSGKPVTPLYLKNSMIIVSVKHSSLSLINDFLGLYFYIISDIRDSNAVIDECTVPKPSL